MLAGPEYTFTQIAAFFSKMAMVTFGVAYTGLAYVTQKAVEALGWLALGKILDGLGMADVFVACTGDDVVLEVSVRDTGIGIPEDRCRAIFEEFEQADTSVTRRFGGTGLGLAISSRLVELMDGSITVKSEVGEGSQFIFTLEEKDLTAQD